MISDATTTLNPHDRHLAGSYELLEEIGSGGMGRVWRARRVGDGEIVAVKVISIDDVDSEYVRRFRREPEIQRGIGHRNIVHLIDWFRVQDRFLLVMEFVDGETLAARIRREGPLPIPDATSLLGQLLDAVGHLHGLGIIHRDVKPSNILIASDGTLKLADFGIARYIWQQRGTMTRHGLGTPEYMSPEQARGEPIDSRSDIYAIGVTFFEMVTGRRPYATAGETPADYMRVIDAVLNTPLPDPRRERPDLPDDLVDLLRRATAKEPSDRPASCSELRVMLDSASGAMTRAGTRVDGRTGAWGRRVDAVRRYARTDRGRWQAVTILILVLIGAVVLDAAFKAPETVSVATIAAPIDPVAVAADVAARYAGFVDRRRPDSLAALYMPTRVEYFGRGGLDRNGLRDRFITSFATKGDDTLSLRVIEARLLADSSIEARWLRIAGRRRALDSAPENVLLRRLDGVWLIARHNGFGMMAEARSDSAAALAAGAVGAGAVGRSGGAGSGAAGGGSSSAKPAQASGDAVRAAPKKKKAGHVRKGRPVSKKWWIPRPNTND